MNTDLRAESLTTTETLLMPKKTDAEKEYKLTPEQKQSRILRQRLFTMLAENWPALFSEIKPLAIGIYETLLQDLEDRHQPTEWLKPAITQWCKNKKYISKISKGGPRYDLNGKQGEISEHQRTCSKKYFSYKKRKMG